MGISPCEFESRPGHQMAERVGYPTLSFLFIAIPSDTRKTIKEKAVNYLTALFCSWQGDSNGEAITDQVPLSPLVAVRRYTREVTPNRENQLTLL